MALAGTVDPVAAREALASVVPRLAELIRSIRNPAAHAVGEWSAADVAVHLSHAWQVLPALAGRERDSLIGDVGELADLTTSLVQGEAERDLEAIAARVEASAAAFLATPIGDEGTRPWLVQGTALPAAAFTCHLLNESLIHGYDIAHAEGRRWRIEPEHAAMAMLGFVFLAMSSLDPRSLVDQRNAAGVRACFDIRVRRHGSVYLVLDDGAATIEAPSDRRVDCHISADPATFFLLIWSRTTQLPGALTGRLTVWGRRPWLGPRLPKLLRNP
jgi:hypothetical protein